MQTWPKRFISPQAIVAVAIIALISTSILNPDPAIAGEPEIETQLLRNQSSTDLPAHAQAFDRQLQLNLSNTEIGQHDRRLLPLQLLDDFKFFLGRPDFYMLVGGVALAPTAFKSKLQSEEPEFTEMWGNSQFADDFFEFGEGYGQGSFIMAGSAALYVFGRYRGHDNIRSFGSDLFRAQIINGMITGSMKGLVRRERPDGTDFYSYPSGHTSSAFTTAGVVYSHFGKKLGIPAFVLATYVGMSRLQENKHFFTDVVAGAIIGSYVGMTIVRDPSEEETIRVSPSISDGAPALKLTVKF